jgi:hypothetical protein
MITPEIFARIRRLFFAEHWKVGTIATELDVHPDAVRRAIEVERFVRTGTQVRLTLLDPYKALILATLEQHPRLRATRLFEMVRDRGYPGSARQVRHYVRGVRPAARAEAYLRLETLPGEQGQVDWGNFGKITVGNAERSLSCFVMVLSCSRAVHARFALDQTLESFLRGHVEAFSAMGGVLRHPGDVAEAGDALHGGGVLRHPDDVAEAGNALRDGGVFRHPEDVAQVGNGLHGGGVFRHPEDVVQAGDGLHGGGVFRHPQGVAEPSYALRRPDVL